MDNKPKKFLVIDPPSGWMYGFPKAVPENIIGNSVELGKWFIEQGYPEEGIQLALKHSRYWTHTDEN